MLCSFTCVLATYIMLHLYIQLLPGDSSFRILPKLLNITLNNPSVERLLAKPADQYQMSPATPYQLATTSRHWDRKRDRKESRHADAKFIPCSSTYETDRSCSLSFP
ncbi:hypothetical protein BKA67DRAFT_560665 [Truncatella angustata]|uniref:Secreted protein n=1 Tax=Truncatella angustata TaxID=152316 RepID=A0A9P8ZZU3_9PEZI|nr:uncharacterized protein BKA67DRAFT_560665 [Truncatella angustata]KAH6655435.1 hypothetical protein BKA67DRAFT_560665 [Truncatella angustata]